MKFEKFKLEFWLNPYDAVAKYNLGSSSCKPVTVSELLEMTGTDREAFYSEIDNMSLHYGYFDGMPRLKKAIANLHTDVVTPEMVYSVHGGTGANTVVCCALCQEEDNIVCVMPNYQQLYSLPKALGVEVRTFILDEKSNYRMDMDQIRKLVDKNTKMINLTNPNNPTGYTMNKAELEELVEIARSVDCYVLCDENYRGLSEDYMYSICDLYEKGISTSSTSKIFSSAGTRVGWIVCRDTSLHEDIMNLRSYTSICEGPINELITAIVLENKEVFYKRNKAIVDAGRKAVKEWIDKHPHFWLTCESMSSTSYIYYDYDIDAVEFAERLYNEEGVLVCHGDCFEQEKSFRIGYGFGDVEYLKAGLDALGRFAERLDAVLK